MLHNSLLFADSISKLFIWISAEICSCALQYDSPSTKSAIGFWSHYALELVENVVLTVYLTSCTFLSGFLIITLKIHADNMENIAHSNNSDFFAFGS